MPTVIGVRFKDSGKIYHFDPGDVALAVGDWAIVETVRGPELGRVAGDLTEIAPEDVLGDLKPVIRRASQTDLDTMAHLQQYLDEALSICGDKVGEHKLPMALVKAEYNFDGSRLTFFFTAEKRVDFRALVRDLARTFHTRIELRQVGPRDEAKLLGGIGPCGRLLCCATFLPDFARVSIKMAKDQDLPLNPVKISGVCGRLLCCLSYEHEQYLDIKAELPQRGAWVQTPEGPGEVVSVNVVRETVTVELTNGNTLDCTASQVGAVTEQVMAEARARNAEGITPVARMRMVDELEADADVSLLAALEEDRPAQREQGRASVGQPYEPGMEPRRPREDRNVPRPPRGGDQRPPNRDEQGRQQTQGNRGEQGRPQPQGNRGEQGRPRDEQAARPATTAQPNPGSGEAPNGQRPANDGGGRRRRRNRGGEGR